ncbi:MAG TPA: hypothetical protein DCQ58_06965, partial [Saprospirales bacterium]|nr:hypothetical protein [Saprospirales bacterium]
MTMLIFPFDLLYSQCSCDNNLVTNGGFNTNVNNWSSYNGDFIKNNAYPQCGTTGHAQLYKTSGTWAGFYQDLSTIPSGTSLSLKFWAGVHDSDYDARFGFEFYYNSTLLSEATLQIDKELGGNPSMQFYVLDAVVPPTANKVRIIGKTTNGYLKVDEVCLNETTPYDFYFDCESGKKITTHANGTNQNCSGNPDITVNIPNKTEVYQFIAEVVYKNEDPGATIQITTSNPVATHTLNKVYLTGTSSGVYVYRGLISGTAASVMVNSTSTTCQSNQGLQSLVVYAFRNVSSDASYTGKYTQISGYCDVQTFSIPIPTDVDERDVTLTIPISELTTDNRYLRLKATAGTVTNSTIIYGPDPTLNTCCVNIVTVTLNNVPGNVNSVTIEIDTRSSTNPGSPAAAGCGQSWVAAGVTTVSTECAGCLVTADVNLGPDVNICDGDEYTIHSTVSGIPVCGYPGSSDCNHTIVNSGGYIADLNTAGVCGDNAGAKLWTQGGNGTSYITLDMGAVIPAGTQITVRVKLEHCSNTSASESDMRIRYSESANSGFSDLVASKTFSHTSYQTYSYTLGASARYIRVQDNGKCSFRLDYVEYVTPDTYNNSITYQWYGPGIVGSTTGTYIVVDEGGDYILVVTDCNNCSASDTIHVSLHNNVIAEVADAEICLGNSVTLTANYVANATYEWTQQGSNTIISTSRSITVSPASTNIYIVTVRVNGCEDSDDATVFVRVPPIVTASSNSPVCAGYSINLTSTATGGTAPYTYNWSGPGGFTSTSQNPTRTNATVAMS